MTILEKTQSKINSLVGTLGECSERDAAYILKIAAIADRDGIAKIAAEHDATWKKVDEAKRFNEDETLLQRKMDCLEFVIIANEEMQ